MLEKVKTLKEVSEDINEELGKEKIFSPQNNYYKMNLRKRNNNIELVDSKISATLNFKGTKQPMSLGHFKSKKGYNTKYKVPETKEFANHYGEYIAYIILKQLGKQACKVDLGKLPIKNPYNGKEYEIEGILSHFQLTQEENFMPFCVVLENYKLAHPKKYRELTERGKTNSEKNYTNIEIILEVLENFFKENGQGNKLPEVRKKFFDMCIFDIKFANRDRHDQNFGIKINQNTGELSFYHLFDNEQILGTQENKCDIINYLENTKEYQKFANRELTSCIGIPGKTQKIKTRVFLDYLLEHYETETLDSINDIGRYKINHLEEVMSLCSGLSEEHKKLARIIFSEREKEINDSVKAFKAKKQDDGPSL